MRKVTEMLHKIHPMKYVMHQYVVV